MHTFRPPGRLRPALTLAAILAALLLPHAAHAAARPDGYPLHAGSHGQRVKDAQWLLAGHRPNVFTKVAPTFKHRPNGAYGARTKAAVRAYKYRLGYPTRLLNATVGLHFVYLLEGKAHRPAGWVATASSRLKAVVPGATSAALEIKAYETSQLGVMEQPVGSNEGATVRLYQSATGAFGLAWCVSFQQWSSEHSGFGTFAEATASVYAALDYFAARNEVVAKPKVGALVAFVQYDSYGRRVGGTGHMGYVVAVQAAGFVSIEGNQANGVHEIFHPWRDTGSTWTTTAFIYRPGIA